MVQFAIAASQLQSQVSDLLPCNKHEKSQLTFALLSAYGLLEEFDHVVTNPICSRDDLVRFHSREYVDMLLDEKHDTVLPFDNDEEKWRRPLQQQHEYMQTREGNEEDTSSKNYSITSRRELCEYFKSIKKENIIPVDSFKISKKRTIEDMSSEDNENELNDDRKAEALRKQFNLEGDCPIFSFLPLYVRVVTGATLALLNSNHGEKLTPTVEERFIGINWDGGRHHAMKQKAGGFCYANDIVLLIQQLRRNGFRRITYVDFDLHHGDGVERAFQYTENVQTISAHLYEIGFFPCTGSLESSKQRGKTRHVVNLPMKHGLGDGMLEKLSTRVIQPCIRDFEPEVIVIQCGGDGLMGDRYEEWQLSIRGLTRTIVDIMKRFANCHVVLLGGGGYNATVMSRYHTFLTWSVLSEFGGSPIESPFTRTNTGNDDEDMEEDDVLVRDHPLIESYGGRELYKFWVYDREDSALHRTLRDANGDEQLQAFVDHLHLAACV